MNPLSSIVKLDSSKGEMSEAHITTHTGLAHHFDDF